MDNITTSYKCPCCDAALPFSAETGNMKCEYCDSELDMEAVREYNEDRINSESARAEAKTDIPSYSDMPESKEMWDEDNINVYSCPFCGAEIVTDETTAASKCPYCDNNMVFNAKLSGAFKPDVVIPFKVTKEAAEAALKSFYEGKFFLPKSFKSENRISEIKGVYVPFWIYDCDVDADFCYDATKSHTWSDSRYIYTKTDHYTVKRRANIRFEKIPADGSSKADDSYMEAIEPYDYNALVPFDKAYLSGFLADKYDIDSAEMKPRIEERTGASADSYLRSTVTGYDTVMEKSRTLKHDNTTVKYGLFPVWMLNTTYNGKMYQFAMNGQTGKMVGNMPCDKAKYWGTFVVTAAAAMLIAVLIGGVL
ncbi:MAG: hypothetical protein E7638_03285 [Ruminococcaceae bacterium]|nr:hypothetical protein [Oscillospiraceae bacterium]